LLLADAAVSEPGSWQETQLKQDLAKELGMRAF
jgi:hypothetical protein